jgi:hypothetical protein
VGQASGLLVDQVDGVGSAVADLVGVEPGQHVAAPLPRVRPSRATSGIGQVGNETMTCSAIRRPSAGLDAWYMDLSCW